MKQPFYLVWNPATGYTKFRHQDKETAENESRRLALANTGQEFIVLVPVSSSKRVDVTTEEFDYGPKTISRFSYHRSNQCKTLET